MPMQRRPSCTGADSTHISTALMDLRTSPPQAVAIRSSAAGSISILPSSSCSKMALARASASLISCGERCLNSNTVQRESSAVYT